MATFQRYGQAGISAPDKRRAAVERLYGQSIGKVAPLSASGAATVRPLGAPPPNAGTLKPGAVLGSRISAPRLAELSRPVALADDKAPVGKTVGGATVVGGKPIYKQAPGAVVVGGAPAPKPGDPGTNPLVTDQFQQDPTTVIGNNDLDAIDAYLPVAAAAEAEADAANAYTDVAALRRQQQRELAAAQQKQDVARAEALRGAEARGNLGGMGLAGSTSTLLGDVSQSHDSQALLDIAAMRERQRGEMQTLEDRERAALADRINLFDVEEQMGRDWDGDGKVGDRPVGEVDAENARDDTKAAKIKTWNESYAPEMQGTGHGSGKRNDPFIAPPEGLAALRNLGTRVSHDPLMGTSVYRAPDGLYYAVYERE